MHTECTMCFTFTRAPGLPGRQLGDDNLHQHEGLGRRRGFAQEMQLDLGDLGNLGDLGDFGDLGDLGGLGDLGDLGGLGSFGDPGDPRSNLGSGGLQEICNTYLDTLGALEERISTWNPQDLKLHLVKEFEATQEEMKAVQAECALLVAQLADMERQQTDLDQTRQRLLEELEYWQAPKRGCSIS
eukprot:Skav203202  [mRNA]  locus=scaffold1148:37829:38383:- [translate_table: standard]